MKNNREIENWNEMNFEFKRQSSQDLPKSKLIHFEQIEKIANKEDLLDSLIDRQELDELESLFDCQDSTRNESEVCSEEIYSILQMKGVRNKFSSSCLSLPLKKPQQLSMNGKVLHSEKNLITRLNSFPNTPCYKELIRRVPERVSNPYIKNFDNEY
jgi:hypothetical protein